MGKSRAERRHYAHSPIPTNTAGAEALINVAITTEAFMWMQLNCLAKSCSPSVSRLDENQILGGTPLFWKLGDSHEIQRPC